MSEDKVQNEYKFIIFLNVADLLSGFLVLYIKRASKKIKRQEEKKENELNSESTTQIELIYEEKEIPKKNYFKKLLVICVLDYISRCLYSISYAITGVKDEEIFHLLQKDMTITLDIFMRYVFSIFILKFVIYRHSIVSIIMIGFGFIILLITDIIFINNKEDSEIKLGNTFFYAGILSFRGILFPFIDTLVKQLFSNNYMLPEKFQFLRGLIEMVLILVITPILYFSFGLSSNFNFKTETIILMIFYTLTGFVKAYFLLKIIYHFSSQSVSFLIISESFGGSITEIIHIINAKEKKIVDFILLALEMIGIFIILLASLIYDEVIIINKWKLNENVKLGIMDRADSEIENIKVIKNNIALYHPTFTLIDREGDEENNENKENNEQDIELANIY